MAKDEIRLHPPGGDLGERPLLLHTPRVFYTLWVIDCPVPAAQHQRQHQSSQGQTGQDSWVPPPCPSASPQARQHRHHRGSLPSRTHLWDQG